MEIVGLKKALPDNVNNLIFKFVGITAHPTADMIKHKIEQLFELPYRIYSLYPKNQFKKHF